MQYTRTVNTLLLSALIIGISASLASAATDSITLKTKKTYEGDFESYKNNRFHFKPTEGKALSQMKLMVTDLKLDPPATVAMKEFGKSKKEGRELLTKWASRVGAVFTGLLIPNVFGPFGNPYYNSVVATFSHQLANGEITKIKVDGDLKLIYVSELVTEFLSKIRAKKNESNDKKYSITSDFN